MKNTGCPLIGGRLDAIEEKLDRLMKSAATPHPRGAKTANRDSAKGGKKSYCELHKPVKVKKINPGDVVVCAGCGKRTDRFILAIDGEFYCPDCRPGPQERE